MKEIIMLIIISICNKHIKSTLKSFRPMFLFAILSMRVHAEDNYSIILKTNGGSGFTARISDEHSYGMTILSDKLFYSILSTNGPVSIWVPKDQEYAFCVDMFDTNGVAMEKTSLGKKPGVHFAELSHFDDPSAAKRISLRKLAAGSSLSPISLFRASDYFEVKEPGEYRLHFEFQFFEQINPGSREHKFYIIRLPMDYTVKKLTPEAAIKWGKLTGANN